MRAGQVANLRPNNSLKTSIAVRRRDGGLRWFGSVLFDWRWDIVPSSQRPGGHAEKFLSIAANNPLALNGALYDRCVLGAPLLGVGLGVG